jgi:hypothetical protein
MTSENPLADRLVSDARKKEAATPASTLNIVALVVSLIALAACGPIPGAGALGIVGAIIGGVSSRKPGNVRMAWGAVAIGIAAIILGAVNVYRFINS